MPRSFSHCGRVISSSTSRTLTLGAWVGVLCGIHPQVGDTCGELLQGSKAVLEQFQGDGGSGQRGLFADRLPDPPGNHCHQNPRHQCPEDQKHQQDHQGRDGSALGERLRLVSHVAPAGYHGHRFRDRRPSKPLCWVRGKGGRTEEGSTGTTQEVCANCITGKTQSQKANWS